MKHKRKKPRKKVRCALCTDCRENIGGDRQKRKKKWKRYWNIDSAPRDN
jgi:hypothetical protein